MHVYDMMSIGVGSCRDGGAIPRHWLSQRFPITLSECRPASGPQLVTAHGRRSRGGSRKG